jgi:membrane-bound serine protease (ClpP class)
MRNPHRRRICRNCAVFFEPVSSPRGLWQNRGPCIEQIRMAKSIFGLLAVAAFALMPCAVCAQGGPAAGTAVVLDIDGAIGPAAAEYVHNGLAEAKMRHAKAVVLRMDTPGGLSSSMRAIIHDILASPIPVIGYVAPAGARAANAGTYIM